MPVTVYTYSLAGDTSDGTMVASCLLDEVNAEGGISETCTLTELDDDVIDITMSDAVDAGEKTLLDAVVAAHSAANCAAGQPGGTDPETDFVNVPGDTMTGDLNMSGAGVGFKTDTSTDTAPTYSFTGHTDTGMYLEPSGDLAFSVNGICTLEIAESNQRLFISADVPNYETLVVNDDDIPNKKYVDDQIGGMGDVTSAINITNNSLVRGDGGVKGIQQSGITISDTDFMSGITAAEFADGTEAAPSIHFVTDSSSGLHYEAEFLALTHAGTNIIGTDGTTITAAVQIKGADGTAAAPGYSFNTDPNTGMWRSAENTLRFVTGAQNRLTVSSVGQVSVGPTSSSDYLMVVHNSNDTAGDTGLGLCIRAGELLGDIAFHIGDEDDTFAIMEVEADQGYVVFGKTYAQTVIDNTTVYGVDNQNSGGSSPDINTQEGVYRIGGQAVMMGTYFQDEVDDKEDTTTSSTQQTKLTLTTPSLPSGKYRVGWQFETGGSSGSNDTEVEVLDGAAVLGRFEEAPEDTDAYTMNSGFTYLSSISGVRTLTIKYKSQNGTDTAKIRRARLEFWRVS